MIEHRAASVCVAQIGARRHYAVPRAMQYKGLLECFITDACADIPPWSLLSKVIPKKKQTGALKRLLGRRINEVPVSKIKGFPLFSLSAVWDQRRGESQTDYWARRNAEFGRLAVGEGFSKADTVYAYNGAALEIFQAAKKNGLRTVLDQTAAPWRWNRNLLLEEARHWPGWEDRLDEIDKSGILVEREEAEWALADRIICGSDFAKRTLVETGGPEGRCHVVTYPCPAAGGNTFKSGSKPSSDGPLRVLFVGTLQLRKGVQYLLQAKKLLKDENIIFRLVGPSQLSTSSVNDLRSEMEVVGAVPRSEVVKHYEWADLFVLPTLSEGSANVVYEAMAAGLPVITTHNAGSIIRDGENGLLVPIRDADALAGAILKVRADQALRQRLGSGGLDGLPDFAEYAEQLCNAVML